VGHVARMRDMRNACEILVGKHKRKQTFVRCRHEWEKVDGKDAGCVRMCTEFTRFRIRSNGRPL